MEAGLRGNRHVYMTGKSKAGLSGKTKKAKKNDEHLGPEDVFSQMLPSEDAGVHDDVGTRRWKSHGWTD